MYDNIDVFAGLLQNYLAHHVTCQCVVTSGTLTGVIRHVDSWDTLVSRVHLPNMTLHSEILTSGIEMSLCLSLVTWSRNLELRREIADPRSPFNWNVNLLVN